MIDPVCLMLIAPYQLRDDLFDYLNEQTDLVSGFTASDAAGHGSTIRLRSPAEQVKGHADQAVVRIILQQSNAERLLGRLRGSFAGTNIVFWIQPVIEFGIIG